MSSRSGLDFGGSLRVALADDEPMVRMLTAQMLEAMGALVTQVKNGHALDALLQQQRFDLVVSDVDMPGMLGTEVLQMRRSLEDRTPFVLISGSPYNIDLEVSSHGPAAILAKPFSLTRLEDAIADVLIAARIEAPEVPELVEHRRRLTVSTM